MRIEGRHFVVIANEAFSLVNFRGPLIAAIVARGWRVTALAPNYSEELRQSVRALGAEPLDYALSRTGTNPIADLIDMLALRRTLKELQPDRVFAFAIKPVIYGMLAARLAGITECFGLIAGLGFGFAEEDNASWRRRVLRTGVRLLARVSLGRAKRVFFQNPDDYADLVRWGVVGAGHGLVVGATGIDLSIWRPQPLPEGPPVFLLAARMVREKGIVEFAEAARRIRAKNAQVRFILLGGLDTNPNSLDADTIRRWGDVEWFGHVSTVAEWLARSSVFVLPSYYREGVPRSTQEAMAIGRAVITTDWPGCRETVLPEENGFLVSVRDTDALEAAMRRFIDDPTLASRFGKRSRELAVERFDVHQTNARLLKAMDI